MSLRIAIYAKHFSADAKPHVERLYSALRKSASQLMVFRSLDLFLKDHCPDLYDYEVFSDHIELNRLAPNFLITLGGDGTILEAATVVRDARIPVLGINLGRMGFLADVAKTEVENAVLALANKQYRIVERSLIEVESDEHNLNFDFPYALNEVTTSRKDSTAMVSVDAYIDGAFLNTYWADGLIVATPTGSTGYSLSCGGPIIVPQARNFVITPIAPHNLNVRPFVIPDNQEIELVVESRNERFLISLDSRIYDAPRGCRLKLKKAGFSLASVQLEEQPFSSTLRSKLFWGVDRRN
jgi:NAD+ kinase